MRSQRTKYQIAELSKVTGLRFLGVVLDPPTSDGEDQFIGLLFGKSAKDKASHRVVWCLADEEGNGPGWLQVG